METPSESHWWAFGQIVAATPVVPVGAQVKTPQHCVMLVMEHACQVSGMFSQNPINAPLATKDICTSGSRRYGPLVPEKMHL